mmetsp:Transcript_13861/g.23901  ORF Transcript_13861/g.23901 Transcript_13861/m.23901 type:complete len:94 (-) Transcript_13861:28-309(-)
MNRKWKGGALKDAGIEYWGNYRENTTKYFKIGRHNILPIFGLTVVVPIFIYKVFVAETLRKDKFLLENATNDQAKSKISQRRYWGIDTVDGRK